MIRVSCSTLETYYKYLFSHEEEIEKFTNGFNINYTHFFRDWEVFKTFQDLFLLCLDRKRNYFDDSIKPDTSKLKRFHTKENYLKNQAKKKEIKNTTDQFESNVLTILNPLSIFRKIKDRNKSNIIIDILSAPCASGEEPYTLAMILDNLKQNIPNFPKYRIIATDIDQEAINKAITGIYEEISMKEIPEFYKNKYVIKDETHFGNRYTLSEKIKNKVEFIKEDLTKGHIKPWKYDIIFCRYLLIYFNRIKRDKFLKIIENKLNIGGLLILGKTETLFNKNSVLRLIDEKNHIYIRSH